MGYSKNYLLYHNPSTMGQDFRGEIAVSGLIGTDKEAVAIKATEENGVIWCVSRDDPQNPKLRRYFLYQRIEPQRVLNNPPGDGFRVTVKGQSTFLVGAEYDITDSPYLPKVKKIISLGLQGFSDPEIITTFEAIYADFQKAHAD